MNRRQVATSMVVGGVVLAIGQQVTRQPSVLAGGWASLEMLNPLQVVIVGLPAVVDAQVLQHAIHPNPTMPGAIRFRHEETGEEQIMRMDVISEDFAIVRGEVTLAQPGTYRMQTWEMGPEIDLGRVQAVEPGMGDVISALYTAPDTALACATGDTANVVETEILDGSFAEPLLGVDAGTTVTWVNTSAVPHQVAFADTTISTSAMLHQDDTFSVTFDEAGDFDYICAPHPYMKGTVRVG